MGEEILAAPDFDSFWLAVLARLPGKGVLPAPSGVGAVEADAAAVSAALRRDGSEGLAPFDPAPWWRVLSSPADSIRRGFGRHGIAPGHVVTAPLLVLAADESREPPGRTVESGGLVEIGPVDRRVVLSQARAAYAAALMAKTKRGGILGLPSEANR